MILRFFAIFWLLWASGNSPAYPSTLTITIDDDLLRTFPDLLDDLQKRTDDYDIILSHIDQGEETGDSVDVTLGWSAQNDNGDYFIITLNQPEKLNISPVPVPIYDQPVQLNVDPTADSDLNTLTGLILYAAGQCEAALPYLTDSAEAAVSEASDTAPDTSALYFYIGNCLLENENYAAALNIFDALTHHDDDENLLNSAPFINAAWANIALGDDDEVQSRLDDESLENAHDSTEQLIRAHRARLYALAFRFDDAITLINAAIADSPADGALFIERGQVRMLLYEWDQVEDDYTTAISLNPDLTEAYFHRGVLYYSILQREQALADFEMYLQQKPDGPHAAAAANYADAIRAELDALGG